MARQGALGVEELLMKKMHRVRRWAKSKLTRHAPHKFDFQFTVMTYNILSQNALELHRNLYYNRNCLSEDFRISRIVPEILRSPSDIICLQEVEQHLFETRIRKPLDTKGFSALYKRRTGDKSDGCAILWRRKMFDLVQHKDLELKSKEHPLLNRDNVAMIAVLKPNHPGSRDTLLHVATTHLLYNPRRGDVKLCQIRYLLAELERMAFKREKEDGHRQYQPIVLCGDFNFEPFSPIYKFVEEGKFVVDSKTQNGDLSGQEEGKGRGKQVDLDELSMLEMGIDNSTRFDESLLNEDFTDLKERDSTESSKSDEVPAFVHLLKFVPAYQYHFWDRSKDMPVSSMNKKQSTCVDHIFYNAARKYDEHRYCEGKLRLLYTYTLPFPSRVDLVGGLPNEVLGSDHFCLMAQFGLAFDR